ncbi:MAG: 30S ribosomal protein S12 methylthiotransferase RimO [Bacteroides sp.]|nr:30S ribosomal protein S12 methylthiotransferase RimO [Bacteroides sp.]MCM1380249.1 30S ribosomal protein S12 methylthiotransferase RimO [Bacteroides sp.]MCM1446549.1 30S ribosomal protein S12 methylthiotransferase RimO [Prevotella sp.]
MKVNIVSLGCFKNLVDTERLLAMLAKEGVEAFTSDDPTLRADAVVINTCGFIGDAKEESIDTILLATEAKKKRRVRKIMVFGCLSERYASELPDELPEVDSWHGKFNWPDIVNELTAQAADPESIDRVITTPPHHAYIKIAEGCNRFCAYCAIPLITGRMHSRTPENIEAEVRELVGRGVKEFNIVAQDLTAYGRDLPGGEYLLPQLVDRLAAIEGVEWLRLHYAYPSDLPLELLDAMGSHPNVCNYLDIALQHIADPVLTNMRRHINGAQTRELIAEMRRRLPGLHLRTTMMVGFPGEGDEEFEELLEFVRETRFERLGAFAYCEEEDTFAAKNFPDSIPEEVKQQRLDRLMTLQEEITAEIQAEKVDSEMLIIIDREEDEYYIGRTEFDSPEVDPEVLVKKIRELPVGEFARVKIVDSLGLDLIAEPLAL